MATAIDCLEGLSRFRCWFVATKLKNDKVTFSANGNLWIKWNIFDYASIFERTFKTKNVA